MPDSISSSLNGEPPPPRVPNRSNEITQLTREQLSHSIALHSRSNSRHSLSLSNSRHSQRSQVDDWRSNIHTDEARDNSFDHIEDAAHLAHYQRDQERQRRILYGNRTRKQMPKLSNISARGQRLLNASLSSVQSKQRGSITSEKKRMKSVPQKKVSTSFAPNTDHQLIRKRLFSGDNTDNFTRDNQYGSGNTNIYRQSGNNNTSFVNQVGDNNILFTQQEGVNNRVVTQQVGDNNIGIIQQIGSDNVCISQQIGNNNTSIVQQQSTDDENDTQIPCAHATDGTADQLNAHTPDDNCTQTTDNHAHTTDDNNRTHTTDDNHTHTSDDNNRTHTTDDNRTHTTDDNTDQQQRVHTTTDNTGQVHVHTTDDIAAAHTTDDNNRTHTTDDNNRTHTTDDNTDQQQRVHTTTDNTGQVHVHTTDDIAAAHTTDDNNRTHTTDDNNRTHTTDDSTDQQQRVHTTTDNTDQEHAHTSNDITDGHTTNDITDQQQRVHTTADNTGQAHVHTTDDITGAHTTNVQSQARAPPAAQGETALDSMGMDYCVTHRSLMGDPLNASSLDLRGCAFCLLGFDRETGKGLSSHQCIVCLKYVHPFCKRTIGEEGSGSKGMCFHCYPGPMDSLAHENRLVFANLSYTKYEESLLRTNRRKHNILFISPYVGAIITDGVERTEGGNREGNRGVPAFFTGDNIGETSEDDDEPDDEPEPATTKRPRATTDLDLDLNQEDETPAQEWAKLWAASDKPDPPVRSMHVQVKFNAPNNTTSFRNKKGNNDVVLMTLDDMFSVNVLEKTILRLANTAINEWRARPTTTSRSRGTNADKNISCTHWMSFGSRSLPSLTFCLLFSGTGLPVSRNDLTNRRDLLSLTLNNSFNSEYVRW